MIATNDRLFNLTPQSTTNPLIVLDEQKPPLTNNALWKRVEQLRRWQESETNLESQKPRHSSRVNFQKPCVFLAACASGDKQEILSLLNNSDGVVIDTANADGMTALHQACIDGSLDMVKFLHLNGANINYQDNEGWAPIHAAASCGHLEISKYLVEAGADLSLCTSDRELAFDLADSKEVADFIKNEMSRRGIEPQFCRDFEHSLMLKHCKWIESNEQNVMKKYVDLKTGATTLHIAAAKGYGDVLELLLGYGSDPNAKDADGWTPLHAAAHWGNTDAAKALMEAGADCDITSKSGHQVWDVCDEDMFTTLLNFKNELKDVVTPGRDLASTSSKKNERIGRLQASLRSLSEKFKNNLNDSNVGSLKSAFREHPSSLSDTASIDVNKRENLFSNRIDMIPQRDFVANRRTRFEIAASKEAPIHRPIASPVRRWGSCVGSATRPVTARASPTTNIRPPKSTGKSVQTLPVLSDCKSKSSDVSSERTTPTDGKRMYAGVTAVTVSSPPPLTVTANVSVSSTSSSTSTPEHATGTPMSANRTAAFSSHKDAEAERKKRSARARRERRSTQGVSPEDVAQALVECNNDIYQKREEKTPTGNRWLVFPNNSSNETTTEQPRNQVVNAKAKPVVLSKPEESLESIDDFHHKRRTRIIQRRPTGRIQLDANKLEELGISKTDLFKLQTQSSSYESTKQNYSANQHSLLSDRRAAVQMINKLTQTQVTLSDSYSLHQYKIRYNEKCRENERLVKEIEQTRRDLLDKDQTINRLKCAARVDQLDRKKLEAVKTDNARLRDENAALIRVISKVSKQS